MTQQGWFWEEQVWEWHCLVLVRKLPAEIPSTWEGEAWAFYSHFATTMEVSLRTKPTQKKAKMSEGVTVHGLQLAFKLHFSNKFPYFLSLFELSLLCLHSFFKLIWERGEGDLALLFHLFMHSLDISWTCPDQEIEPATLAYWDNAAF